jgi:hypothetical protein
MMKVQLKWEIREGNANHYLSSSSITQNHSSQTRSRCMRVSQRRLWFRSSWIGTRFRRRVFVLNSMSAFRRDSMIIISYSCFNSRRRSKRGSDYLNYLSVRIMLRILKTLPRSSTNSPLVWSCRLLMAIMIKLWTRRK